MTDYIKREDALKFNLTANLRREKITVAQAVADAIAAYIESIPAADVAPVVRCNDCAYRHDDGFCAGRGWPLQLVPDDGYCDRGARMDGGVDDGEH